LLEFRWVDRDGCDHHRTLSAMQRAGFAAQEQAWDRAAVVDMQGTWDEYFAGRKRKWRQNVRRLDRRLQKHGDVTYLRYRPDGTIGGEDDPRWDLYDTCVRLAECSWQGASRDGTTLCHPGVRDYLRDAHAAAARTGSLDLNLLLLGGQPVAFHYNYYYRGKVYGLRKGFDPEFASLRPGTVLEYRMLRDGFQRGDTSHDMGVGYLDMKRHWLTTTATSYRYTHFPMAVPRVQLLRMKRWLDGRIHGADRAACTQPA
jgi:CelD/BcsL family acetyltransferase involved in cellulose biosynthesis